jgi:hypothetical protein
MRARVFKCQNEEEEGGRWKVEGVKLSFPALERVDARRCKMCRERERESSKTLFENAEEKRGGRFERKVRNVENLSRNERTRVLARGAACEFRQRIGFHFHF